MAKIKIRFWRLVLTGIIWVPVYLDLVDRLLYRLFGFSPLVGADWRDKISAFLNGSWVVETPADWGLFAGMVLVWPLLIAGWVMVYRIRWKKLFRRREKIVVAAPGKQPQKRVFEPAKLRVQSSALLSVPLGEAPVDGTGATGVAQVPPVNVAPPVQKPAEQQFDDEEDVQKMLTLTAGVAADFFPHVILDGAYAAFALSTDKSAAVVRIINRPESVWAVDTDVPPEESDWFDQNSILPAPAKDAIAIARNLHEHEPDSVATPVVLLMSGRLLNVEETLAYFEKHQIILTRLETAEVDEIPLFSDFAEGYFGSSDKKENPS